MVFIVDKFELNLVTGLISILGTSFLKDMILCGVGWYLANIVNFHSFGDYVWLFHLFFLELFSFAWGQAKS